MNKTIFDIYMARRIIRPFATVMVIAIMLLSLENLSRLMVQLQNVEQPIAVLLRFMGYLLPEYLGIGVIFALFLGVAFGLRGLALSGELNVVGAAGISPWRMLRAPMIVACLCTLLFVATRGYLEPWGERQLVAFGNSVRVGELGMMLKAGQFYHPSPSVTFHANAADAKNHRLLGVMVKSDGLNIFARSAHVQNGGVAGISVTLENGQMLREREGALPQVADFETARVILPAKTPSSPRNGWRQSASEYSLDDLVSKAVRPGPERSHALAAVAARLAIICALPLLPFLAIGLAIPPQRQTSAFGIGVGIVTLVLFIQFAHAIEGGASQFAPLQALVLWAGLVLFTAWSWRAHLKEGPGYIEGRLSQLLLPWAKRLTWLASGGRSSFSEVRNDSSRGVFAS